VLYGLVDSVLPNILTGEFVFGHSGRLERHSVVHVVDKLFVPYAHISNESVNVVAFGHLKSTILVESKQLFHHQEGHVLIIDVKDKTRSALVDLLGQVSLHHEFVDVVSLTGEVLVDQVEGVPFLVLVFVHVSALSVGDELLVSHHVKIEVKSAVETLLAHPVATVTGVLDRVS